jgi:site-specific recombinase XerD
LRRKPFDWIVASFHSEWCAYVVTFRHAFATHLLEAGHNIRVVQQLMGHKEVETTMIHTHVMNNSLADVRSPADALA